MGYARQTTVKTKTRVRKRMRKSSGGTKGKQRRCPTCGKYM